MASAKSTEQTPGGGQTDVDKTEHDSDCDGQSASSFSGSE